VVLRRRYHQEAVVEKLRWCGIVILPERQLFKIMYEADNDKEDLDFYELTQVLVMGK